MIKKLPIGIIIGLVLTAPLVGLGQSAPPALNLQALIEQLQEQIRVMQEQILSLQAQLSVTREEVAEVKAELKITRSLQRGAAGDEVKQLQEFLKRFPDIYPEGLVTGYFGPRTEAAVKKLQEKHGIEAIGIVGPKTIAKLNELVTEGAGRSETAPPGLSIAPGLQEKLATSTSPATPPATTMPIVSPPATTTTPQTAATTTVPAIPSVSATTTGSSSSYLPPPVTVATPAAVPTPAPASAATTTPSTATTTPSSQPQTADTTPPIITNVSASALVANAATITWYTTENSDSLVEYGPTTAYEFHVLYGALTGNHSVNLTGLTNGATYHYRVKSKDVSGNLATSPDQVFGSLAAADPSDAPPVITTASVRSINSLHPDVIYAGLQAALSMAMTDDKGLTYGGFNALGMRLGSDDVSLYQCGNGVKSCSAPSYTIVPDRPGDYTVTVKAADTAGQTASKTVTFTAIGCSLDAECGGTYFPSSGATFCGLSGETIFTKRMKYQVVSVCQSGACNERTEPGVLEDCGASGKICGFALAGGGQFQCVSSPATTCAPNAAITSSCLCGSQSYEQYGYCCLDPSGNPYQTVSACQTSAAAPRESSLAAVLESLARALKNLQQLLR